MSIMTPAQVMARIKLARFNSPVAVFSHQNGLVDSVFAATIVSKSIIGGVNKEKAGKVLENFESYHRESSLGELIGIFHRDDNLREVKKLIKAFVGELAISRNV